MLAVILASACVAGVSLLPRVLIQHACVLAAAFPLAILVTVLLNQLGTAIVSSLKGVFPTNPTVQATHAISSIGIVTFMDVSLVALYLMVCYGSTVMLRRLVDTVRILKVSRRRLLNF